MAKEEKLVEIPNVETKELNKYVVYRKVVSEFCFHVLAEDIDDAERIVEEKTSICEYTDYAGVDIEETYIDAGSYISDIEEEGLSSAWFEDEHAQSMHIEDIPSSSITLYKMEGDDWEDTDAVFDNEDDCIDNWKELNEIED